MKAYSAESREGPGSDSQCGEDHRGGKIPPPPQVKYQPMSFEEKNMKRKREKGGNVKKKEDRERNEKMGGKKVK